MAPLSATDLPLLRRYYCNINDNNCYSGWDYWGRWVFLGVVVAAAVLIGLILVCFNNRRRRRRGAAPMYGTGWMAPKPYPQQNYPQNYQQPYFQPAPPYSPPQQGYYGQRNDVELQQPDQTYHPEQGGTSVYQPPEGPPPGKQ